MTRPGSEIVANGKPLPVTYADRERVIRALPPRSRDVRIGVGVIIAAASVLAAVVLTAPDNYLAFTAALGAIATLIVAPVITVGLMIDVRHQKRSGGHLPPGATSQRGQLPPGG
jgi:hypothetical protein